MEPAAQKDSSKILADAVSSSHSRQSMAEKLKVEGQNRVSNLLQRDHPQKALISKENTEESDVDSGHNSIGRHSLSTEMQNGIHNSSDIPTDYGRRSANIWIDSAAGSAYDYAVDVGDSVIYHDPIRPTEGLDYEQSSEEVPDRVFTTVARKKSVFITVDKWTSEPVTIKEVPPESEVKAASTLPEVTYGIVNKKKSRTMEKGGVECSDGDAVFCVVDAEPEKKRLEDGRTNLVGCCRDLDGNLNSDIGDADDLYDKVDHDEHRNAGKNVYTYVDGKVMIISDDGDYASVKSLTDSDSSKTTEVTVVNEPPISGIAGHSSKSVDASVKRNRYAVQYLGSIPISDEELSPQNCTAFVAKCISGMSQNSSHSQDSRPIYEWPKDSRMFLETCETKRVFALLSSDSVAVLAEHFLNSIRFWAVGKEPNSKHFAYVIRNATQKYVCRIFLCDVVAKHIASTIRNICQRLAIQHMEVLRRKSIDSGTLLDGATEALKPRTTTSAKNEAAGVVLLRSDDGKRLVTECNYIGKIKVTKAPGKDILNNAAENVFTTIPKEKWARVDLQFTPTSITIKELTNSGSKSTVLPTQNVIYMGSSTKNKKLSAIFIQSDEKETFAHIFHCEPHAKDFIKQVQAACEIGSNDKNRKSTDQQRLSLQQSKKGLLFGKSKGK